MIAIVALQTLIIVVLFWMLAFYGKDEFEAYSIPEGEETISSPSHVSHAEGTATIILAQQSQQQSGITTSLLQPATHRTEVTALGSVVPIDTLLELRTRYLAARADAEVIRASIQTSKQEFERLALLNRDNRNVSDRAVAAAESTWKAEQARLAASETAAASLKDSMRQQWGETIASWAAKPKDSDLQRLIDYSEVLVQVTLPYDAPSPQPGTSLRIIPAGSGDQTVEATLVSKAPQTDNMLQGRTFFFRAPADRLRAGMRVSASLSGGQEDQQGVFVPPSALVWYANQAWIYLKQGPDKFVRKLVQADVETDQGWFNQGTLKPGDEVVTSGAQLLLSEEFKNQITNENED
ncbi:MAG: hypothetical protein FGM62_04305 [Methylobacterium sp.]|nr:hypothetical protein [Methylobacterium sp.]